LGKLGHYHPAQFGSSEFPPPWPNKTDCELLSLERKAFKRLLGPIETILKRCADSYSKFVKK
jgi:hypothetical protein